MSFLGKVSNYIAKNSLLQSNIPLLIGFSGGADSVVLADSMLRLGYRVALAHCNFHLRGSESDSDEKFVREFALERSLPIYVEHFYTTEWAKSHKVSVEMAARELRYRWFEKLILEHRFQAVAVAHHQNDQAETVIMNLARGTGLAGLAAMRPLRDKIVRPLLCVSRSEIESYAKKKSLKFCVDKTNSDTEFHRNRLRHNVLPELLSINPSFVSSMQNFTESMAEYADFFQQKICEELSEVMSSHSDMTIVDLEKLRKTGFERIFLFEAIRKIGFPASMFGEILDLLNSQAGRYLSYQNKVIAKDRDSLIIFEQRYRDESEYVISPDFSKNELPLPLSLSVIARQDCLSLNLPKTIALLDFEKLTFPLSLRLWREGDCFQPFGMRGRRKVSDFLKDQKLDMKAKSEVWILKSADEIAWVVGYRISQKFAIDNHTKKVLKIELLNK